MSNVNNKKNFSENILKLALTLVLILILGIIFYFTWLSDYNELLRFPYVLKGNIFLMFVYMVLLYIFMLLFDCNNISEHRVGILIFSELLACISCNMLVYFVVIIPAAALGLMPILPILRMTIYDFIIIFSWCIILHNIYLKIFKALQIVLITNEKSLDETVYKINKRNDLYDIKETYVFDGNLEHAISTCSKYENVIIGDIPSESRNDLIKYCFKSQKNMYCIPKISDIILKYSDDLFVFDAPLVMSKSFGIGLEVAFFKRMFDIVISIIVITVFLPIWVVIGIIIKCEDRGPIFFLQERITKDYKKFNIIKYRSMKVDNLNLVRPTTNNDDRITRIGRFIRKFHLDEIPQFINVLLGDMSIVGPRPERIEHVELYTKMINEFEYRHKVKAGITGLAQVYGKYNTSAMDKLKLDLIYIKKCSLLFDLELILRTLRIFLVKENTEGFNNKNYEYIKINANK